MRQYLRSVVVKINKYIVIVIKLDVIVRSKIIISKCDIYFHSICNTYRYIELIFFFFICWATTDPGIFKSGAQFFWRNQYIYIYMTNIHHNFFLRLSIFWKYWMLFSSSISAMTLNCDSFCTPMTTSFATRKENGDGWMFDGREGRELNKWERERCVLIVLCSVGVWVVRIVTSLTSSFFGWL